MPKTFEDEIVLDGERLRHYFRSDDYGFPSDYGTTRYATRAEAIRAREGVVRRRREEEIRESFSPLRFRDLEDLYKCPDCYSIVEGIDRIDHHSWHGALRGSSGSDG